MQRRLSATSKTMTLALTVNRTPTMFLYFHTFEICDIKHRHSYENGTSEASETRRATIETFERSRHGGRGPCGQVIGS